MIDEAALLSGFPSAVPVDPSAIASRLGTVLVVLDDDPTGTQSVADLPVLTAWDVEDFEWALARDAPAIYVLTNTRSLAPRETATRVREVVTNAITAATRVGVAVRFVSRGDSTLRGHFPLETDVLAEILGELTGSGVDAVVVVPAFPDAGRITVRGVHYLRTSAGFIPVGESEFARDATFGYDSSDLREYVEEKSEGRWPAHDITVLDLESIRSTPAAIGAALCRVIGGVPVVADAASEDDLRMLALGCLEAEAAGAVLLYRVGPPFVRARIGQAARQPLTADEIYSSTTESAAGGLIVVGSHVDLTNRQLARLRETRDLALIVELSVESILDPEGAETHLTESAHRVADALQQGDVVLHTSRHLRRTEYADESLALSRAVSAAVVRVVQLIVARRIPRFVIAKGGITSSDVATQALGIRRAIVRGPMLPGIVSAWQPVDGDAVGVPYVVFAGNVGDDDSLAAVVDTLSATPSR